MTEEVMAEKQQGEKRPVEETATSPAKKARVAPDAAVLKKQVEYYFSDGNLSRDKFFHDKISSEKDGWLDVTLILSCNKVKALKATNEDVLDCLKGSELETKTDDSGTFIRRTTPLPTLQDAPRWAKKSTAGAHAGGVIFQVIDVPEDITWVVIKDELRKRVPEKVKVQYAADIPEKNVSVMLLSPFDNDLEWVEKLDLKIENAALKVEVCHGDALTRALRCLPKHIQRRREMAAKERAKKKQRPVVLGEQKFANLAAVRSKIKEVLMSRVDGTLLIDGSPDTELIKAVLQYHPRAAQKLVGMKSIKVDANKQHEGSDTRCFWLVKEDGTSEDVSVMKCLQELERKLQDDQAKEEASAKVAEPAKEDKKEAAEEKKEEAKEEKKEEAKEEAKEDKKEESK